MPCKTHRYLTVIPEFRIITTSRQFLFFKKHVLGWFVGHRVTKQSISGPCPSPLPKRGICQCQSALKFYLWWSRKA